MGLLKTIRVQWDRAAAAGAAALGALCLIAGWVGASGAVYPAQQLPYFISGGLGGLLLVAIAATLWLSADLRDEWRHLDGLERRVEARVDDAVAEALAAHGIPAGSSAARADAASGPQAKKTP